MAPRAKTHYAALSDVGRTRTHNEDSVLAQPPLYVVADGLGGHEAGEVASSLAVATLRDHAPRRADANALARAVRAANREVIRAAKEGIGKPGMGTTITAAIVEGGRIVLAHVGDSRAYLLHDGVLERLTDDHSMVADMVRRGQLTEEEARVHPNRSVITRALGTDANMVADTYEIDAAAGDRLLLSSDGLSGMLEDATIAEILGGYRDPATAGHSLIAAANEAGGHDNISVVIVDIDATSSQSTGTRESERSARSIATVVMWLLAFAVIVGGIAYGTYHYAQNRAFLIAENGVVVMYRGVPGELGGYSLKWHLESTDIPVAALSPATQKRLAEGEQIGSVEEALNVLGTYRTQAGTATPGSAVEITTTPTP